MTRLQKLSCLFLLAGMGVANAQVSDSSAVPSSKVEREDFRFMLLPGVPPAENKVPVDFSIGLIGNESYGVKYMDFSVIANKAEGDITGIEFAGILNRVHGSVSGVQFGGLINTVSGPVQGFQVAGLVNSDLKMNMGMQVAGAVNLLKENSDAIQVAGITNYAKDTLEGAQISGLCNVTESIMNGAQITGFNNVAKGEMNGVQIAGMLNVAHKINGAQIGLINISDTINGVPVGFFSYSRSGYHRFEVSNSEVFPINASFHTGVNAFHNIFSAGVLPTSDPQLTWYVGYGFGTAMPMGKRANLLLNVNAQQISKGELMEKLNLLNVGFLGVEFSPVKKVWIVAGPTLNAWMTKTNYKYPETIGGYIPETIFDQTSETENLNTKMWIGWKVGLRFF